MKKNYLLSAILMVALIGSGGCATRSAEGPGGPGMIVHFGNALKGRSVQFRSARTSNAIPFPNPGGLSPSSKPLEQGAVMGAAPDGRELPEWIDFTWVEAEYGSTAPFVLEEHRKLPIKSGRVLIRQRIPADVVAEVLASHRGQAANGRKDLRLWVFLIWREDKIAMRWNLEQGCCDVLRSGGDDI
ncbi:MAG: hypothetical protein V4631_20295 [Pseudomonadota bacterium]